MLTYCCNEAAMPAKAHVSVRVAQAPRIETVCTLYYAAERSEGGHLQVKNTPTTAVL